MPTSLLKRLLSPRPKPLDVLGVFETRHGAKLPEGELRRYLQLAGELDFAPLSHRAMELAAPRAEGIRERIDEGVYVERIQALLCATSIIATRGETFYAASWAGCADGSSLVYYIQDNEWGMRPARTSIASFIFKMLDLEPELYEQAGIAEEMTTSYRRTRHDYEMRARRDRPARRALDPERLFLRSEWLIDFFLYVFRGCNVSRWVERLAQAAPFAAYEKERELVQTWPHLAVYWLWSHYLFENVEALDDLRALLVDHPHAAVKESLELISDIARGAGSRGRLRRAWEFCSEISLEAPERVFCLARRQQRTEARQARRTEIPAEEQSAERALLRAAKVEPSVEEALVLLHEIDRGLHVEGENRWRLFKPQQRLGELVDWRFEPLLRGRIQRGARHLDEDRRAARGVIYAYAQIEESYGRFSALMDSAGTKRYGGDRLSELYRAIGCYDAVAAAEHLVAAATRYVAGGDSTQGTLHKAAFWQLLRRDAPEGAPLIASYLTSFDPLSRLADQWTCINVILAAGRLGMRSCHDDILRLVCELGIGYYTNVEHRGPLLRALWKTGGDWGYEAVRALLEAHDARSVDADDGSDEWAKQKHEESCLVAVLHMMRPEEVAMRRRFDALVGAYAALELSVGPLCFYGMSALLRAIEVARLEGHGPMIQALADHEVKPKHDHLALLAFQVRKLARALS